MSGTASTRPNQPARIRDPSDGVAWAEFVDIHGPLVHDYGRRRGLQHADAADLPRNFNRAVAAAAGRLAYDPPRGGSELALHRDAEESSGLRRALGDIY